MSMTVGSVRQLVEKMQCRCAQYVSFRRQDMGERNALLGL